jgi:TRAP-type mannitol/chloroaromatic compound transport system permease small subunit
VRLVRLEVLGSLVLIAAFFLPWFSFNGAGVPGYRAADIATGLAGFLAIPGDAQLYAAYLIYPLPLFAAMTLLLSLAGRSAKATGFVAGFLPLALLVFFWLRLGNELFSLMTTGSVLSLLAAPVVLFGAVGALNVAYGIDWFTTRLGYLMYWTALAMVVIGAAYVIMRYVGRGVGVQVPGSNFFRELQVFLFNMVFLLGAAFVLIQNAHVRVDLIYATLTQRARAWIDIIGAALFLIPFCLLGLYLSHSFVVRSWRALEMSPNPGGLPLYPSKSLIIAAFILLILQGVSETVKNIAFLGGKLEREEESAPQTIIADKTELL